jgi:hypothetical protein
VDRCITVLPSPFSVSANASSVHAYAMSLVRIAPKVSKSTLKASFTAVISTEARIASALPVDTHTVQRAVVAGSTGTNSSFASCAIVASNTRTPSIDAFTLSSAV